MTINPKIYPSKIKPIHIKAAELKGLSAELVPLITLFYTFLPAFLGEYHDVDYDRKQEKLILKRKAIEPLIEEVEKYLQSVKMWNGDLKESFKNLRLVEKDWDHIDEMEEIVDALKTKGFKKLLDGMMEKKLFDSFYIMFTRDDDFNDADEKKLKSLIKHINFLPSPILRKMLKSIKHEEVEVAENFEKNKVSADKASLKLFGTKNPSQDQKIKIGNDPKKKKQYEEWKKENTKRNASLKDMLMDMWVDENWEETVDVSEIAKVLKEMKVNNPIDPGFKGRVALGPNSVLFSYYTSSKIQLASNPGVQVEMYPLWDPQKDSTAYCRSFPNEKSKKKQYQYSIEYKKNQSKDKFEATQEMSEAMEELGDTVEEDMFDKEYPEERMTAIVIKLGMLTQGRMGNSESEKEEGSFGLHNLQSKHVHLDKGNGKIVISYVGKKGVKQNHVVSDPDMIKILLGLKKGKNPKEYMFSLKKGGGPVSPNAINKYIKEGTGVDEAHFHYFRHIKATEMFTEYFDAVKKNKGKWKEKTVQTEFENLVNRIAKVLGNEGKAAKEAYIDPQLQVDFHKHFGANLTKSNRTTLMKTYVHRQL